MVRNRFLFKAFIALFCIVIALWMCKNAWWYGDFTQSPQLLQRETEVICHRDEQIQSCIPLLSQAITLLRQNSAGLCTQSQVSAGSQKSSKPDRRQDGLGVEGRRTQTKPIALTEASRRVPVFVVEEHHEVIPYWFSSADKGILRRQGNVLFHIDGHSDGAPPIEVDSVPLFRWPGADEWRHLMQENDVFIFSAALTGLLDRYIWIVPPWDPFFIRGVPSQHLRVEVHLGVARTSRRDAKKPSPSVGSAEVQRSAGSDVHDERRRQNRSSKQNGDRGQSGNRYGEQLRVDTDRADNHATATEEEEEEDSLQLEEGDRVQSEEQLCLCIEKSYINTTEDGCLWVDYYQLREMQDMTHTGIPRSMCDVGQRVLVEVTTASKAVELLARSPTGENPVPWLSPTDSLILDIDEDFYGCEAAIGPLLATGLSGDLVDKLSTSVGQIFCPSSVLHEQLADGFFSSLAQSVRSALQASCCHNHSSTVTRQRKLQALAGDLAKDLKRRGLLACTCRDASSLQTRLQKLLDILARLNPDQLTALIQVGICLQESPMTDSFDPSEGMVVCSGYNRPNKTSVLFHTPTTAEVSSTTRLLGDLLGSFSVQPRLVSICRSVRDGYTPRSLFRRIEKDVLSLVEQSFDGVGADSIVYDQNLLGGRAGWPDRH